MAETYRWLIARAHNPQAGDDDLLLKVCTQLDISVEDAEADAAIVAEIASLQPIADDRKNRDIAHSKARGELDAFDAETERIVNERKPSRVKLGEAEAHAGAKVNGSISAAERIQKLQFVNRSRIIMGGPSGQMQCPPNRVTHV